MKSSYWIATVLLFLPFFIFGDIYSSSASPLQTREIRVVNTTVLPEQSAIVSIEIVAQGNENAIGFSLNFNQVVFSNPVVTLGSGVAGAILNVNTNQAADGRVGIALALPPSQSLSAGVRLLVTITFNILPNAPAGISALNFSDLPIAREVVDTNANTLTVTFTPGSLVIAGKVTSVSAASYSGNEIAVESIVAAFGVGFASESQSANTLPLPTELAGTKVVVKDRVGVDRLAPLFFVGPSQVNYLLPQETVTGIATITITSRDNKISIGSSQVAVVAPGLFSANISGQGVPAAVALRVKQNGDRVFEPVFRYDSSSNSYVTLPIDIGPEGEQVFLILFGTGFRYRSSLSTVDVKIGGTDAEVLFAGPTQEYVGQDQCNVRLPRSLAGRGEIDLMMMVDGKPSNSVKVNIK